MKVKNPFTTMMSPCHGSVFHLLKIQVNGNTCYLKIKKNPPYKT